MLVHWATSISSPQQQLLPYGNTEGTHHLIVLSGGEPFESWCYDVQGLVSAVGSVLKK